MTKAYNNQAKSEKQSNNERLIRDCLILIHTHLQSFGYIETAAKLLNEAGGGGPSYGQQQKTSLFSRLECADNINLMKILYDYEEFHELKFGFKPKLSRTVGTASTGNGGFGVNNNNYIMRGKYNNANTNNEKQMMAAKRRLSNRFSNENSNSNGTKDIAHHSSSGDVLATKNMDETLNKENSNNNKSDNKVSSSLPLSFILSSNSNSDSNIEKNEPAATSYTNIFNDSVIGTKALSKRTAISKSEEPASCETKNNNEDVNSVSNLISTKPLPDFGGDMELRSLAFTIQREIIQSPSIVKWEDVVDLQGKRENIKQTETTLS